MVIFSSFQLNIPAHAPVQLHDHDEFLNADVYLNGINIYKEIITSLGNVPGPVEPEPPKEILEDKKKEF